MAKYTKTGQLGALIKQNPKYGDFSEATDYQESVIQVQDAQEQFKALPSKIRGEFHNDPAEFLDFANDPANQDKMKKLMGLSRSKKDVVIASAEDLGANTGTLAKTSGKTGDKGDHVPSEASKAHKIT